MTAPVGSSETRRALARGEWRQALDLLARSEAGGGDDIDPAERFELRAQAAYGAGEFEAAITAWEELYAHHLGRDETQAASRAAAMVAMHLMIDTGLMAAVRGWLRRADSLLVGRDECAAHAVIAMVRTYERFMCGDMDAARTEALRSLDLGERLGVTPATVIGRVASARLRIFDGAVAEGVEQLDEVAILLATPEVDPLTTGMMYCELICAAQGLGLHDRAAEWTAIMDRWRPGEAIGGISGRCRVHRAEMLRISGPCDAAEQEALAACEELRPWMRREFGWPLVELGTIRLRKGDLDGAEEAFLAAHEHGWFPQPGLAMLRLERGEPDVAAELIDDAVAHPVDIPSKERPPFGDLRLAPLLEAQSEIALARGDAATAATAAGRLRSIADTYASSTLAASAALAEARAALASGDHEAAVDAAGVAVSTWAGLGAPFETAVARVVLAGAHRGHGANGAARLELSAAASAFESFGATRRAAAARRLLAELDGHPAGPPAEVVAAVPSDPTSDLTSESAARTTTAVFRAEGGTRRVCFAETEAVVRDLKGLRYVERLLAEPGREFHVLDLVAAESGATDELSATAPAPDDGLDFVSGVGAGLPMIDDEARRAYQRRLADVDEDIEDARRHHDLGRLELAERDREYLLAELRRAVGLDGRIRTTGSSAERARTSVTRSIRYALERLADQHPAVAEHLGQHVHTGTYCCYVADPFLVVDWHT